jgi:hypothetical protein
LARNQHITPRPGCWAVQSAGGARATSLHKTQAEAIQRGREIARNQGTELLVHGRDGQIRERDSYGRDPFPPAG